MAMIDPKKAATWIACVLTLSGTCFAQALKTNDGELNHPKVEVFTGYSYYRPMSADIDYIYFKDLKYGAEGSVTYFVKPWLGIQLEAGAHVDPARDPTYTSGLGLQFQTNLRKFVPFAHALAGPNYFGGPAQNKPHLGWTGTAGFGLDWVPSYSHQWLGVRLLQADYQYNYNDFGPLTSHVLGGLAKNNTLVGSAGLVFRFGGGDTVDMATQMSCSADRVLVAAGDQVNVSSQVLGFDVMKAMEYTWNTSGGKIVGGGGESITIDTTGLPSGDYKVSGNAVQGKRASRQASCSANFSIRSNEPPTVSCIASPFTIPVGGTATVTATGVSPQNRPLTYSFLTSGGRVANNGNVATVTATAPGDILVTCNVQDDQQHAATATTTLTVTQGTQTSATTSTLPPLPLQNDMCSVSFDRDRRRPARVNNEAKACLDDIALAMQHQQDATLVLVGDHTGREGIAMAAERAVNVKSYLTQEKGIDSARVQVRAEDAGGARVRSVFLPVGASYNEEGRVVNEGAVVHHGEAYGRPGGSVRGTTRRRSTRRAVRRRR